jgi:hypothetical protein
VVCDGGLDGQLKDETDNFVEPLIVLLSAVIAVVLLPLSCFCHTSDELHWLYSELPSSARLFRKKNNNGSNRKDRDHSDQRIEHCSGDLKDALKCWNTCFRVVTA